MSGATFSDAMMKLPESIRASVDSSKAEYRRMGDSGLKVSVPILGAMSYGRKGCAPWMLEADEALPLLQAAYDRGLNTWDTSNNYSNGFSEKIVGQAIKKYNIPRQKLILCTKCFGVVSEDPDVATAAIWQQMAASKDYVNQRGLSRQAIFNAVAGSLERLQTDYIDLLQIHRFDYDTPIEETMAALNDLVRSGKVRYIGASSMWTFQFTMMQDVAAKNGWTKFISMQNHYSLLYREEEREMNKYCNLTGVGLMPWSPLCRGHLARPVSARSESLRGQGEAQRALFDSGVGEPDETIIGRVEELAKKKGWKMSQVALAWINKRCTSPIVGLSSLARIDEALESRGKVLSDEEEKYLEELYTPKAVQGHL
ncbi:MAG: hypothetical protein M1828_005374 [Chrysothrix sp. TS-e1954]|nr:MAG: hypothetical protein M1828_005374 [Chrysothrix sp. TS-e1954]